jgi:hypothetical protein
MSQAARAATSGELALLRAPGDWSRAYFGIYKPNVIYTALLNGAPASTDMVGQISFDGGTGTLADVKAEMTLWVGSTAGGHDLGVCRIRKAPISGTIYIGYTSEIDWADNCHLTIVDHAMLNKRPVVIEDNVIKMDGETAYTNQHTVFNPVPVLGCHAAAWLTGASVNILFDAGDSWVYESTISAYSWSAPGSSASSGMATATPTITYNAAGYYRVSCTVTAANGKTSTGVRFVMVFDADNKPYRGEVRSPNADYETGGWSFGARMFADADPTEIIEGALCILFSEDWYGSTKQSIGQVANRENIICWGYIAGESIEWDAEVSSVEFSVQGPQDWLKKISSNPLTLNFAKSSPTTWEMMPELTVDRALWHVLYWRSNAAVLLNITLTGDARYAPKIESMEGSLWAQMKDFAWQKIFGHIGCDRYGRFYAVIDPQLVPEASRTWATVMTLTKKDWRDRIDIKRIKQRKLALLSMSGWVTDDSGAVHTLYSLAMGHLRAQYGESEIKDKLLATSQSQFNTLTGLYMGWKNKEFDFDISLSQNNRLIDLWPNQFLDISLAAGDTPRGIAYAGNLVPRSITLQHDPETGCWSTEISCEAETFAELAIKGDIPNVEPAPTYPPPPTFPPPTIPPVTNPPPTTPPENQPEKVIGLMYPFGVAWTETFDEYEVGVKPEWKFMNAGLETATWKTDISQIVITPGGAIYIMTDGSSAGGWSRIMRASSLGASWETVFLATEYSAAARITGLGVNKNVSDQVAIVVGDAYVNFGTLDTHKIYVGSGSTFSAGGYIRLKYSNYQKGVVFWKNNWIVAGHRPTGIGGSLASPRYWQYSADGSLAGAVDGVDWSSGSGATVGDCHAIANVNLILWGGNVTDDYVVVADLAGASMTRVTTGIHLQYLQQMAVSPTGVNGMGNDGSTPYKSTDSFATWQTVSGTIPVGSDVWDNCNDDYRWIFGGGVVLRLTMDQGATYIDKMGNLTWVAPLMDISMLRYIE